MVEKLSEKHIRDAKVKKLKLRILSQIETQIARLKDKMRNRIDEPIFDKLVQNYYHLTQLKLYITEEESLCSIEESYADVDIVVYTVPSKVLDIWLADNCFVSRYLYLVKSSPFEVFDILDDFYIGHYFTDIFTILAYDHEREKLKNN